MSTLLHCNEVCRGKSAYHHVILEWLASNALDTKISDPWRFINCFLSCIHVYISQYTRPLSWIKKQPNNFRLIILKKKEKRKERENKQYHLFGGQWAIKGKNKQQRSKDNFVTQLTHPLLTLLSHNIVKITVRSVPQKLLEKMLDFVGGAVCSWYWG